MSTPDLTAVVMADASHSALEPLVDCPATNQSFNTPFALMPFANRPLIETLLETLRRNFVTLAYIVCSPKSGDAVSRWVRGIQNQKQQHSRGINNIKIKVIQYAEAPSAAACLRALLSQNQLPDRFVFVPVEAVFASLCLPDMVAAHTHNERSCGAVLTVGLNFVPGVLSKAYEHLQKQAAIATVAAESASSSALATAVASPQLAPGSFAATLNQQQLQQQDQQQHDKITGKKHNNKNTNEPATFPVSHDDGFTYDGDLWTVVYEPRKSNVVKQFASWREVASDNLRQMSHEQSARNQLIRSDIAHYTVSCSLKSDVRIQSSVEFTGIAVCSSALVTQILQMHGNLLSMVDICRCIIENAELSDATFAVHFFSTRGPYGAGEVVNATATMNSLVAGGGGGQQQQRLGGDGLFSAVSSPSASSYRSVFLEMSAGGFQTPPHIGVRHCGGAATSVAGAAAAASLEALPPALIPSSGQQRNAATVTTTGSQQQQQQAGAGAGGAKRNKPGLPGAPKMHLALNSGGGTDASGAAATATTTVTNIGGGRSAAAAPENEPLFFAGPLRSTTQFVPIYNIHSVAALVRAHVAAASRQLLSLSMVMPSYTAYRGHPSVFVNVEGSGASFISVEARLGPNVVIGCDCVIPSSCVLQNCCIGDRVTLDDNVVIRDSVVHNDVVIRAGVRIRRSAVGRKTQIERSVKLRGCIVAPNAHVATSPPENARLVAASGVSGSYNYNSNSNINSNNAAPALDYFSVAEAGLRRNFSAHDHGIETDITLLFAKVEDPRFGAGGAGGDGSGSGAGGAAGTGDEANDARERFFRTIRPQVERALADNSPADMLQPMLWRRTLIDLDGYTVSDLLEAVSRALIQIVGRRFSHKSGTLPAMTPTSKRSASGLSRGGGAGGGLAGGGDAAGPQREFDATDRENAVNHLVKNVLQVWIPTLLMPLCRSSGSEFERDQIAIVDGLCRGVGSGEGEVFADADAARRILQQFMRFGVFSRNFLDDFKTKMDEELEVQAEQLMQAHANDTPEAGSAGFGHAAGVNTAAAATSSDGLSAPPSPNARAGGAATTASSSSRPLSSERLTRAELIEELEDPLFTGWMHFEEAIAAAVPMEHTTSFMSLGSLARHRSLDSIGAASTPKSSSISPGFPNGGNNTPQRNNKNTDKATSNSNKQQAAAATEKPKKQKLSFLKGGDSSSSSNSSGSSSDDDDDDEDDDSDENNRTGSGTNESSNVPSVAGGARSSVAAPATAAVGGSAAKGRSPWSSAGTTPPVATPVTAHEQQQNADEKRKKTAEEKAAAEEKKKRLSFLKGVASSSSGSSGSSSSDDDDDSDDGSESS